MRDDQDEQNGCRLSRTVMLAVFFVQYTGADDERRARHFEEGVNGLAL